MLENCTKKLNKSQTEMKQIFIMKIILCFSMFRTVNHRGL